MIFYIESKFSYLKAHLWETDPDHVLSWEKIIYVLLTFISIIFYLIFYDLISLGFP